LGMGTLQGISDMGYALAQNTSKGFNNYNDFVRSINPMLAKKHNIPMQPRGNIYYGPAEHLKGTTAAKIGENLIAPMVLPMGAEKLAASMGPGLMSKMLAYGTTGAAVTPGGGMRQLAAGLTGAVGGGVSHFMSTLPYMFKGKLGVKIEQAAAHNKEIGKELYTQAFKGTEKAIPQISEKTTSSLADLAEAFPAKANPITKAVRTYNKSKTITALHSLKSDLMKKQSGYAKLALSKGLTATQEEEGKMINKAIDSLGEDISDSFQKIGPEAHNKYLLAQQHWKDNVVPFKHFSSIRNVLGKEREISPRLYTDLTKDSVSANRLRTLLKTNLGSLQLARLMHHKVAGLPLPAYLGLGGGYGLFHIGHSGDK
jgi:hypothetical protein